MAEIEREAKLTLSPGDYQLLERGLAVLESRDQLNVYLHDPDRLEEDLGYLRVRYEAGREAIVTLKIPVGWDGEVREMVEVERPLKGLGPGLYPWPRREVRVESNLPEEMCRHFLAQGISRLRRLGWMRNLRRVLDVDGLGTVELDRTQLPGGAIHYEVEIEQQDEDLLNRLVARIREMAPSAESSRVGKFSLFLEAARGAAGWSREPGPLA